MFFKKKEFKIIKRFIFREKNYRKLIIFILGLVDLLLEIKLVIILILFFVFVVFK